MLVGPGDSPAGEQGQEEKSDAKQNRQSGECVFDVWHKELS